MTDAPLIKVRDMAFPRVRVPDLDAMEGYLRDFGFHRAERTDDRLYMRGDGPAPYAYAVERGEPAFLGFAFEAASREDLEALAASEGFSAIEPLDGPGGGWRTRTIDPYGLQVDVVFGRTPRSEGAQARKLNMGARFERLGVAQRITAGPSRIKRFAHIALNVPNAAEALAWYHARFGLIPSDRVNLRPGLTVAIFSRCDRGAEPADHHTIFFVGSLGPAQGASLNHMSWEVFDVDDVLAGNAYLAARSRRHEWGIGRHLLGSQIFDYWRDPWGHIHEHWTDGDQFDADVPAGDVSLAEGAASQWGPNPPPTFGRTLAEA